MIHISIASVVNENFKINIVSVVNENFKFQDHLTSVDTNNRVRGVIITMKCKDNSYDFISRYFSPWNGIPEDPVTGSAHTVLAPYWQSIIGKSQLFAKQCSRRGGELWLDIKEDCLMVSGQAAVVLEGKFNL